MKMVLVAACLIVKNHGGSDNAALSNATLALPPTPPLGISVHTSASLETASSAVTQSCCGQNGRADPSNRTIWVNFLQKSQKRTPKITNFKDTVLKRLKCEL